jgi:hypothetical protein
MHLTAGQGFGYYPQPTLSIVTTVVILNDRRHGSCEQVGFPLHGPISKHQKYTQDINHFAAD